MKSKALWNRTINSTRLTQQQRRSLCIHSNKMIKSEVNHHNHNNNHNHNKMVNKIEVTDILELRELTIFDGCIEDVNIKYHYLKSLLFWLGGLCFFLVAGLCLDSACSNRFFTIFNKFRHCWFRMFANFICELLYLNDYRYFCI